MRLITTIALASVLGTTVLAQESSTGYPVNTTIKGYAKRDRVLLGSIGYVSPAQLHEIKDTRIEAGGEINRSSIRTNGISSKLQTPNATFFGAFGNDVITGGLSGSYLKAANVANSSTQVDEEFTSKKLIPQLAVTIGKYVTVGGGAEINWLNIKESSEFDREFAMTASRGVAGIAYHNETMEIGVAYSAEAQANDRLSGSQERGSSLSLSSSDSDERAVYIPAETRVYVRGNLADSTSIMGLVGLSRYDSNVTGAVGAYDNYDARDRMIAKLIGTYWTSVRSRLSLIGEYKGGATTAVGSDEAGLGYRLVNTYGGAAEAVLSLDRKTYVGLIAGYNRGERDDTVNGVRYTGREISTRVGATFAAKF